MSSKCEICGNEYTQYHRSDKYCKDCRPKAQMIRWNKYKVVSRERVRAAQKRYRDKYPDRTRLAFKKHYYANRERVLQKHKGIRRRYYVKHAERLRKERKNYYHENLVESQRQGRISARNYRLKNSERYRELRKNRIWKESPEARKKRLERIKKWQQANPERVREAKKTGRLRRYEKHLQVIHAFTIKQWKEKLVQSKGICSICQNNVGIEKLTLDHIIPLSKAPVGFV